MSGYNISYSLNLQLIFNALLLCFLKSRCNIFFQSCTHAVSCQNCHLIINSCKSLKTCISICSFPQQSRPSFLATLLFKISILWTSNLESRHLRWTQIWALLIDGYFYHGYTVAFITHLESYLGRWQKRKTMTMATITSAILKSFDETLFGGWGIRRAFFLVVPCRCGLLPLLFPASQV